MTERENNVYKAKLAEQAERYDGEYEKKRGEEKNFFFFCQRSANFWGGVQFHARRVACATSKIAQNVHKFIQRVKKEKKKKSRHY